MYTIMILQGGTPKRDRVLSLLSDKIAKDGRFRAILTPADSKTSRAERQIAGQVRVLPSIMVDKVRLTEKKPYCGNHPGPCLLGGAPKPVSSRMEWEDWVEFHTLVNQVLNRLKCRANVWSLPYDVKGRMWIRKDRSPRLRYEYTETPDKWGRPLRHWNTGTDDQFQAQVV